MGVETGISWCDSTWNAIRGCSRVSEGCRFCYAESTAYRFSGNGQPYNGLAVLQNGHAHWTGKIEFVEKHLLDPLKWKPIKESWGILGGEVRERPRRIFVNSMSDLFHENVTDEMRDKIFSVMALCPQHIFQCLTKRPERMLEYLTGEHKSVCGDMTSAKGECALVYGRPARFFPQAFKKLPLNQYTDMKWPLPNVWMGVSCEDQKTADQRIPILLQTPAAVKFISAEPLLGPIDLEWPISIYPDGPPICCSGLPNECGCMGMPIDPPLLHGLHWVVTGGESGSHARPMLSRWAEDIKRQCDSWNVAFFHKQNGEWVDAGHEEFGKLPTREKRALRSDGTEWDLKDMPEDDNADVNTVVRVGRKRAGETLYGKVYHAYPGEK